MDYLLNLKKEPSVIIGHDCRFGGQMFLETATAVFCSKGIRVVIGKGIVSTPMVSLGAKEFDADMGIVITASHNPPSYNGYKLKSSFGGPSSPEVVSAVEALIPVEYKSALLSVSEYEKQNLVSYADLEGLYMENLKNSS